MTLPSRRLSVRCRSRRAKPVLSLDKQRRIGNGRWSCVYSPFALRISTGAFSERSLTYSDRSFDKWPYNRLLGHTPKN
jgi:hypothetical protein